MTRRYQTGYQNWVRERNLAIVLNQLWEAGQPVSRTHLVELSGLNKSTVGNLIAQLQTWGFVKESGVSDPRPGRPATLIEIDPDGGRLIGAEIGVDFVPVALTDLKANVVWRQEIKTAENGRSPVPPPQDRVLEQAEDLVQEAISRAAACKCRLFGIGLGVPGLVDRVTGTLLFAPNLRWRHVPLRDMWAQRFGVPVVVENEAKAAAVAEQTWGEAKQADNFLYLSASVGLGGAVVIDGRLLRGMGGNAGAVGHMTIEPDGPQCNCGNRGCWETLIGPRAILQRVREEAAAGHTPGLLALDEVGGQANAIRMEHILRSAVRGEPAVLEVFAEVGRYLGIGVANLINAFNPSLVVLGGVLGLAGPFILPRTQEEVYTRALATVREGVRITLSAFKLDACVMGGAALILRAILNNPTASVAQSLDATRGRAGVRRRYKERAR
jgi:glucokinase-like ROK family protein